MIIKGGKPITKAMSNMNMDIDGDGVMDYFEEGNVYFNKGEGMIVYDEFPEGLVIDRDDSDQRADVQEYGQRQGTVSGNAHEVLEHGEMTGAGDRQEFGGTLNDAEDDRFEIFHHNRMWLLLL